MLNTIKLAAISFLLISNVNLHLKAQVKASSDEEKILKTMQSINSKELFAYVDTLSSDKYEGRLTGHIGYDRAAEWAISKFKEWNIKPLGTDASFLQKFPHPYTNVFNGCVLKLPLEMAK